jgi:NitT/TauT family transport system permease protein
MSAVATGNGGPSHTGGGPSHTASAAGAALAGSAGARELWLPLPRRRPSHWSEFASGLLAIRSPISSRARWILVALSVLLPLTVWLLFSMSGRIDDRFLPSPMATLSAGLDMIKTGQLQADTWASVQRVLLGFGLAVAVSVPLGMVMGTFRAGQAALEPLIGLLRYLPASAFIPLVIIWLGLGEPSKIAILFIGTVFFNTLMTADVVRQVPGSLIDVSYTLGARRGEVIRKVIVPHSVPGMLDAMRVNAAAAWNFVVVAELIASESGLGYRIARAQRFTQTDKIFAVLVVIGLIGLAIDITLRLLRDRFGRWAA